MVKKLEAMYVLYDNEGNPVPSTLRYQRKNSIGTLEPIEWKLRQSQGWSCRKVNAIFAEL